MISITGKLYLTFDDVNLCLDYKQWFLEYDKGNKEKY